MYTFIYHIYTIYILWMSYSVGVVGGSMYYVYTLNILYVVYYMYILQYTLVAATTPSHIIYIHIHMSIHIPYTQYIYTTYSIHII